MEVLAPYLITLGRVLLSIFFIEDGLGKIGSAAPAAEMKEHGVPVALLPVVIFTEVVGGLCVLTGLFTPFVAIALAGFCLVTGLMIHFDPKDAASMINFMKNVTMAGGFPVLAGAGPGAFALDNLLHW